MAVTLDYTAGTNLYNNVVPESPYQVSWSHTTSAGSNTLLLVAIQFWMTSQHLVSVTFGADNLTEYTGAGYNADGSNGTARFYYKINPTVQTADIVTTYSGSDGGVSYASLSWFGAHQTTPLYNPQNYTSLANSVTLTTVAGDMAIDTHNVAMGTVQGSGVLYTDTSASANNIGVGQYLLATGASTTLTWQNSNAQLNTDFGVVIQAAGGGGDGTIEAVRLYGP